MDIGIGIGIGSGGGVSLPTPDALFDTRTGLVVTDSIGGLTANIRQFPVANWKNTAGAAFYTQASTFETPITTSGDYTMVFICRNENSGTIASTFETTSINGNARAVKLNAKSGALYVATGITQCTGTLGFNATGKVVGESEPWVVALVFDSATNGLQVILNGTQIDTATDAGYVLGGPTALGLRAILNLTDIRVFGEWIFDRKLTTAEVGAVHATGTFPNITPSRQYIHSNYGDVLTDRFLGSHNRNACIFTNNNSNSVPPDEATIWASRYDNAAFAYSLLYGFTSYGNYKIPYAPTGSKMMTDALGDIEHSASGVIHNMADSLWDFTPIADATAKAIFDKSNRTYWKASIESELYYTDAGSGYYGLWSPEQLLRDFIITHAATGHENHIFSSLRNSGQKTTGITAIRIFKTNVQ